MNGVIGAKFLVIEKILEDNGQCSVVTRSGTRVGEDENGSMQSPPEPPQHQRKSRVQFELPPQKVGADGQKKKGLGQSGFVHESSNPPLGVGRPDSNGVMGKGKGQVHKRQNFPPHR